MRTPEPGSQGTFDALKQKWNTDARSYCASRKLEVRQSYNCDTDQATTQFLPPGKQMPSK